jgi:hypothetical protein
MHIRNPKSFEVKLMNKNVESSLDVMYVIEFNFDNLCIRF